jgi:hypothetical protein
MGERQQVPSAWGAAGREAALGAGVSWVLDGGEPIGCDEVPPALVAEVAGARQAERVDADHLLVRTREHAWLLAFDDGRLYLVEAFPSAELVYEALGVDAEASSAVA